MRSLLFTAIAVVAPSLAQAAAAAMPAEVVGTYADIAEAGYGDSLSAAQELKAAVEAFLAAPSAAGLEAARAAWIAARVPYQQTEVFRFGNPIVDDWEGKVNAWPLDEGLIDYVDASYGGATDENELAALNVIANPTLTIAGQEVDASAITPELIADTLTGRCPTRWPPPRRRFASPRFSRMRPSPQPKPRSTRSAARVRPSGTRRSRTSRTPRPA